MGCPECGEQQHLYCAATWCANCGWHTPLVSTAERKEIR